MNIFSGILIIFLGLFFLGILKFPFLDLKRKLNFDKLQNLSFSFINWHGICFWLESLHWTYFRVLAIAINDSVNGTLLLTIYSIGLAFLFNCWINDGKLIILSKNLAKFSRHFQILTGLILLLTGILILNGTIQSLGFQLNSILPSLNAFNLVIIVNKIFWGFFYLLFFILGDLFS